MKLIIIAAVASNNAIGKDNKLLWHIKEDLKFFKEMTTGKNILMGKNTFLSLGKPLPNRHHIIISSSMEGNDEIEVFRSIEEFKEAYKDCEDPIYVIGGGMIYNSFINEADEMHLTEIEQEANGDTFFPEFDKSEYDREVLSSFEAPLAYKHVYYKRKRK